MIHPTDMRSAYNMCGFNRPVEEACLFTANRYTRLYNGIALIEIDGTIEQLVSFERLTTVCIYLYKKTELYV